jgi:carotenoid cleavage dioxygenase-like enzyme
MAFVHNPDRSAAELVILAAQDFTAEPVARVHLPARIPLGFHGNSIPTADGRRRSAWRRPSSGTGRR